MIVPICLPGDGDVPFGHLRGPEGLASDGRAVGRGLRKVDSPFLPASVITLAALDHEARVLLLRLCDRLTPLYSEGVRLRRSR